MKNKKIYAFDFDGTIVTNEFPKIGKPIREVTDLIFKVKEQGHYIILNTMREGRSLDEAREFLFSQLGIRFDAVNDNLPHMKEFYKNNPRKIFANYYIDDHNMGISAINKDYAEPERQLQVKDKALERACARLESIGSENILDDFCPAKIDKFIPKCCGEDFCEGSNKECWKEWCENGIVNNKCKNCTCENMCITGTVPNNEECIMKGRNVEMVTLEQAAEAAKRYMVTKEASEQDLNTIAEYFLHDDKELTAAKERIKLIVEFQPYEDAILTLSMGDYGPGAKEELDKAVQFLHESIKLLIKENLKYRPQKFDMKKYGELENNPDFGHHQFCE